MEEEINKSNQSYVPALPTDEEENNGGSQDKQVKPKLCSFPSLPDYVLKEEEEINCVNWNLR